MPSGTLPQGVGRDERLHVSDQLVVPTKRQLGLEPRFEGAQA